MAGHRLKYFSYLLRIWQADRDEEPVWRASLQRPGEEQRRGFAGLEELFAYLRSQAGVDADPPVPVQDRETADEKEGKNRSDQFHTRRDG